MKAACFWRSFQGPAYKGLATLFAQPFVVTQEGQSALLEATPADSARRTTDHGPRSGAWPRLRLPAPLPSSAKVNRHTPLVCSSAHPLPCGLALNEPLGQEAAWAACLGYPPMPAPGVPQCREDSPEVRLEITHCLVPTTMVTASIWPWSLPRLSNPSQRTASQAAGLRALRVQTHWETAAPAS